MIVPFNFFYRVFKNGNKLLSTVFCFIIFGLSRTTLANVVPTFFSFFFCDDRRRGRPGETFWLNGELLGLVLGLSPQIVDASF